MADEKRKQTEFDQGVYRDGIASRWTNWGLVIGGIGAAALTFAFRKNLTVAIGKAFKLDISNYVDDAGKLAKNSEAFDSPEVAMAHGAGVGFAGFAGTLIGGIVGGVSGIIAGEGKAKRVGNEIQESRAENEALRRENILLKETKGFAARENERIASRETQAEATR